MCLLGIEADQYFLQALKQNKLEGFVRARQIFPFERAILQGEAEYYVKSGIVTNEGYDAVKLAHYYDPYLPRFLSLQMQYAFYMKDDQTTINSFYELKKIAPKMPIIKEMIKRGVK